MKKIFIVFLIFILHNNAFCVSNIEALKMLQSVNPLWQYNSLPQQGNIIFNANKFITASDKIQLHLQIVIQKLIETPTVSLTTVQKNKRQFLIQQLEKYTAAKIFPINTFTTFTTPIFINNNGTHCAVGYLMQQSGFEHLAQQINSTERFEYLKNIKTIGVHKWACNNGFTLNELALIQPGYKPNTLLEKIADGFNGPINVMMALDDNSFIVGGSFSKAIAGNITCNNIARVSLTNGTWQVDSIGSGTNGAVTAITKFNNQLVIAGSFDSVFGKACNTAVMWDMQNTTTANLTIIANVQSNINTVCVYKNALYCGTNSGSLFYKWYPGFNVWVDVNKNNISGNNINALEVFGDDMFVGGDFKFNADSTIKNACKYNDQLNIIPIGNGIPNIVNDFEIWDNTLYAGCNFFEGDNVKAIYKFDSVFNGILIGALGTQPNNIACSIKQMTTIDNSLFVCGDFFCGNSMTTGRNLMQITKQQNKHFGEALLETNNVINCVGAFADKIIVGGNFTNNKSYSSSGNNNYCNRLGSFTRWPLATKAVTTNTLFNIFPNPVSHYLNITVADAATISIADISGKVYFYYSNNTNNIDVSYLKNGMYIVTILFKNGSKKSQSFVKE
jgi:Secretion system C-terminal sorting domain